MLSSPHPKHAHLLQTRKAHIPVWLEVQDPALLLADSDCYNKTPTAAAPSNKGVSVTVLGAAGLGPSSPGWDGALFLLLCPHKTLPAFLLFL